MLLPTPERPDGLALVLPPPANIPQRGFHLQAHPQFLPARHGVDHVVARVVADILVDRPEH